MTQLDLGRVVGSKIHHVSADPGAELGLEGDWALNTDTGAVWEKTAEGWTERGSFKGEKGEKGDPGDQGIPGEPGEQGIQGEKGDTGAAGVDGKTPMLSINDAGHLIATFEA